MALTPVEILHMTPGTGFFGYKRAATDRLLAEIVSELRGRVARARRPRRQGRTARGRPRALPRARGAPAHDARVGGTRVARGEGAGSPRGGAHPHGGARRRRAAVHRRAHSENERLVTETRPAQGADARRFSSSSTTWRTRCTAASRRPPETPTIRGMHEPLRQHIDVRVGSSTDALTPISTVRRSLAAGPVQWLGLSAIVLAAMPPTS